MTSTVSPPQFRQDELLVGPDQPAAPQIVGLDNGMNGESRVYIVAVVIGRNGPDVVALPDYIDGRFWRHVVTRSKSQIADVESQAEGDGDGEEKQHEGQCLQGLHPLSHLLAMISGYRTHASNVRRTWTHMGRRTTVKSRVMCSTRLRSPVPPPGLPGDPVPATGQGLVVLPLATRVPAGLQPAPPAAQDCRSSYGGHIAVLHCRGSRGDRVHDAPPHAAGSGPSGSATGSSLASNRWILITLDRPAAATHSPTM